MKILYVANARMPTEKAHGIQIVKTCESFANEKHSVTLLVPKRRNHLDEDPYDYYGVDRSFNIERVFSLDLIFLGRLGFLIQTLTFTLSSLYFVWKHQPDVIFSRDDITLYFLGMFDMRKVYEAHMPRFNFFTKKVIEEASSIISISNGLKKFLIDKGADEKRIVVAPDGVDLEMFSENLPSREKAREILNLPLDKKIVLYTGTFYDWKGAHVLAETEAMSNTLLLFVGGSTKDTKKFRKKYKGEHIEVRETVFYKNVPFYLHAADVLVIPNSAKSDVSKYYTSPMKLFEYMASKRPIVASDLPSIKEVLNDDSAVFFEPDNSESLTMAIEGILDDKKKSESLFSKAFEDVSEYTWNKRTTKILNFIDTHDKSSR